MEYKKDFIGENIRRRKAVSLTAKKKGLKISVQTHFLQWRNSKLEGNTEKENEVNFNDNNLN